MAFFLHRMNTGKNILKLKACSRNRPNNLLCGHRVHNPGHHQPGHGDEHGPEHFFDLLVSSRTHR
jgi:hypothetical protein